MNFNGGKYNFATALVERMRNKGNFRKEICVVVFSCDIIND